MKTDIVLVKLDSARKALMEAKTIQETKKIVDVDIAKAAEIYAKRQHLGEEAVRYATGIKMEALRQLGNMLKESAEKKQRKGQGQPHKKKGLEKEPFLPTLADMGLDKKTSKIAQDVASLSMAILNLLMGSV